MKTVIHRGSLILLTSLLPLVLNAQWALSRFDEHNYFTHVKTITPDAVIVTGMDGVGMGSFILRSNDGGINWDSISINIPPVSYSLVDVNFTDINNGYAGGQKNGNQLVLKTTDNGSNWSEVTPDPTSIDQMVTLHFIDPLQGYASDGNNLYKTIDGGQNWNSSVPGFAISDIQFSDMDNGYACGDFGTAAVVMNTNDGGQTWSNVLNVNLPLFVSSMQKLDMVSPYNVFCSGKYSNVIFHTIDAGFTWDTLTVPLIFNIQDFDFVSPTVGHVLSNMGEIYGTNDGGNTWVLEYAVASGAYGPSVFLSSISFAGTTGYVCGSNGLIKKYTTVTGLSSHDNVSAISLFPNPVATDHFITASGLKGIFDIDLYNADGRLVRKITGLTPDEKFEIDVAAGVYVVVLTSAETVLQQKLVVFE